MILFRIGELDWLGLFEHFDTEHIVGYAVDGGVVFLGDGEAIAPEAEQPLWDLAVIDYPVTELVGLSVRHLIDKLL